MSDLDVLKKVSFFASLDAAVLERLAKRSRRVIYGPGTRLVSELESGADVFVVMSGEAEVSVDARDGTRKVLKKLAAGSAFGEMSSLTGELRSATVSAVTEVDAMVIADADFDRLREEHPEVALVLVRELAERLHDAEASLEALLTEEKTPILSSRAQNKGSIARVWRELVVGKKRDCAFLTFAAFVSTLLVVRLIVRLAFEMSTSPRAVLQTFYLTGFALVGVSACTSLLTFRIEWRRWIAVAYGIGVALILNELGVTLAFDIFYKDIHTADPDMVFDVERLYRRAEPMRAIAIGLVVLVQAAYLRRFYVRAAFVLMTRLRRLKR